jgi:hypothetical protein
MSGITITGSVTINQGVNIGTPPPSPPTINFITPTIMNAGAFVSLLQPCASAIDTSGLITVIGSDNGNSGSAVSSNGTSWTGPTQEITGSTFLTHITWSSYHNYFLAIGVNSSSNAICSTSSDGVTWTTPAVISGALIIGNVYAITVNSAGLFVAIMILNPGGTAYSTSTDGSTWTTPTALPGAVSGVFFNTASITVNSSGKFVVTGYNGFDSTPWYSVSTNGSSWTTQQMFNSSFQPKAVIWSSFHNLFVTVGNMTSGIGYSTSANGSTWTTPALISGSTSPMLIVALAVNPAGEFVGVGQVAVGGIGQALYMTSANGSNWGAPLLFNSSTNPGYMRSVVYSTVTNSFVAVGFDNTGPNWLYSVST